MIDPALKRRFIKGWLNGGRETPCGGGSTIIATATMRPLLRPLLDKYGILSVNDAGAGDLNWIRHVDLRGIVYRGFDLIPRHPSVIEADITDGLLPYADAILCRAVLNHLPVPLVEQALNLFKPSCQYLLATQFDEDTGGKPGWADYDLREFGLGDYLEALPDVPGSLALWKL